MRRLVRLGIALGSAGVMAGCGGEARQQVDIAASASLLGQPVSCDRSYVQPGAQEGMQLQLADARVYLSKIELLDGDRSTWVPLKLDASRWQGQGVALLDFEDASGACADSGTAATNTHLRGSLPVGNYVGLRFEVGVPQALNHLDVSRAQDPLREAGMFWTWQGGYKFLKFDLRGSDAQRYNVHLGAAGCPSPAPVMAPNGPCARPNRAKVTVFPFDPTSDALSLDLGHLLAPATRPPAPMQLPAGCMGDPDQAQDCQQVMSSLGLDLASGQCVQDCGNQALFSRTPAAGR